MLLSEKAASASNMAAPFGTSLMQRRDAIEYAW